MKEDGMDRLLSFLRDELNKYDDPFIQFFKIEKLEKNALNKEEILEILQKSFVFFSIAEELESQADKWKSISSTQVYEILRAIVSLDSLPDEKRLRKLNVLKLGEYELIGFLYVAHMLQFNGYQFSCKLKNTGIFPENRYRTFNTPIQIIKSWDDYLTTCDNHEDISSYQEIKNGITEAMRLLDIRTKAY